MSLSNFSYGAAIIRNPVAPDAHSFLTLLLFVAIAALALFPLSEVAGAGSEKPSWLAELTPLNPRPPSGVRPVKLLYEVSWSNFLAAGTIDLELLQPLKRRDALLQGYARTKSKGGARLLWPYDSEIRAQTWRKSLLPYRFETVETERGEKAEYVSRFRRGVMSVRSRANPKDGGPVEVDSRVYRFDEIRDLLSTLLYLRASELRKDAKITLLAQPLDRLYLVSFFVRDRERRKVLDKSWNTIKLDIGVRKVKDDFELAPYGKMRRATMWLSDDRYRLPVEVQADVFIGFVSVRLKDRSTQ